MRSRVRRLFAAGALALVILISLTGCNSATSTPTTVPMGNIEGSLTIGPLCPVEPCSDPPNPYPGLYLDLFQEGEAAGGIPVFQDGRFAATVHAGEYEITLRDCEWLGCDQVFPAEFTVPPGETVTLDIDIDTGIR